MGAFADEIIHLGRHLAPRAAQEQVRPVRPNSLLPLTDLR